MEQGTPLPPVTADLREHMKRTSQTAAYPFAGLGNVQGLMYVGLGLSGESGEIANQIKKIARDDGGLMTSERTAKIVDELGDVMWYWLRLCYELNLDPYFVLAHNQNKLAARAANGTVNGDRRETSLVRQAVVEWEVELAEAAGKEDVFALPFEGLQRLIVVETGAHAVHLRCRSLRCPHWNVSFGSGTGDDLNTAAMTHIMQEHTPWGRAGRE